jgi:hypothetical protein
MRKYYNNVGRLPQSRSTPVCGKSSYAWKSSQYMGSLLHTTTHTNTNTDTLFLCDFVFLSHAPNGPQPRRPNRLRGISLSGPEFNATTAVESAHHAAVTTDPRADRDERWSAICI